LFNLDLLHHVLPFYGVQSDINLIRTLLRSQYPIHKVGTYPYNLETPWVRLSEKIAEYHVCLASAVGASLSVYDQGDSKAYMVAQAGGTSLLQAFAYFGTSILGCGAGVTHSHPKQHSQTGDEYPDPPHILVRGSINDAILQW
jgi:hypothetical protein